MATYTALATITLSSSASSVTFSNIGSGFRDLRLVFNGKISGDFEAPVTLNSDSSGNYYAVNMRGDGSSYASSTNTGATHFQLGLRNVTIANTDEIISTIDFLDSSATDKHKTILKRVGAASKQTYAEAVRWASTSAVTTISMSVAGGSYLTGSTFSLFGIEA